MAASTRFGDLDSPHCSGMERAMGSYDVMVNSRAWSRQTDLNTVHLKFGAPCPMHSAPITLGSVTVFVNSLGAGRVLDSLTDCTAVAQGSETVFAGG